MARQLATFPAVLLCLLPLGGCLGGSTVSCDHRPSESRCNERSSLAAADPAGFEASCEGAGGTFRRGFCPRADAVAACDKGDIMDWYYAPATVAEVTFACEGEGTLHVP